MEFEIFYCVKCEKWHDLEDSDVLQIAPATSVDPAQYTDESYCNKCGYIIEDKYIVDDIVRYLNKKKIRG